MALFDWRELLEMNEIRFVCVPDTGLGQPINVSEVYYLAGLDQETLDEIDKHTYT